MLLREVLALQAILLFNANRAVQKSLYHYFIHTREEVRSQRFTGLLSTLFRNQK